MASNILFLPFRRSVPVSLSEAIKQYISTKYDQHPDMFTTDLQTIDKLRSDAIHSQETHVSGIKKLQQYAAQLMWMGGKFPIDIGVDFPWYPAIGYNTSTLTAQDNIRFELANIIFNLAAMYSQLAFSSNRADPNGLKTAANYFCLAAGTLSYIKSEILPDMRSTPPEDMDPMTLESLEQLMLAQGQECFWQKAVKDGLKDGTIAKLAAKVSDLYTDAQDFGSKSDALSSEWLHHMSAKHHHFAAAAQYRAACDCLEKKKYGEEVARLRDCVNCVNVALKEARYINKTVLGDLNGLKDRVQEDLKRAEKDNDMIYLMTVPPKSELSPVDRATMVKPKVPPEVSGAMNMLGEHGELGKPLFTKLVPYSVHVAASIYVDRRDRLVNQVIDELESMTTKLHELLKSLNLPGSLQALEKPLGLPPGLVSHAEEIRQQDGMNRLYRATEETNQLRNSDRATYQEGVNLLQSEAAEDDAARRKHGTERWTRQPPQQAVPKLYAQIEEVNGYLKQAASSDDTIQTKLRENEKLIRLLAGPDSGLEHFVPSARSATMSPAVEKEATKLRGCLNEVSRLESRRRRKVEAIRSKAKQDDINPDLLREAARLEREFPMTKIEAAQFENLFDRRLEAYSSDQALLSEEQDEQAAMTTKLQHANGAFVSARRTSQDTSTKERERALQSLENAFFKYKEVVSNLDSARKFYNDLATIVNRFRDDCRTFAYTRRAEATSLEQEIRTSAHLSNLSLGAGPSAQLLQEQMQAGAPQKQQPYAVAAPGQDPIPAPQPSRPGAVPAVGGPAGGVWNPEMGIKFGGMTTPSPGGLQRQGVGDNQSPAGGGGGKTWDANKGMRFG